MPRPQRKATAFEPKTGRQPAKRPLIEKGGELHEVGLTATKILNKWLRMNTEKLLKEISITTARNYRIRNTTGSDLVLAAYASPGINIDTASKVKGPHGSILKELARLEQSHSEIVAEARKKKNQETFNMLIGLAPDKDTRLSLTRQREAFEKEIANARAQIGKTHVLVRLISAARAKAELDYLNKLTERTAGQETRRGDVAYEIVNFHTPFLKSAGLYSAGSRLEDETFKITNPEEYDKIESQVGELSEHVESIKKEVKTDLRRLLKEAGFESSGLSNLQIEIRQKSIASIYRKMNEGGGQLKYPSVDRIHDLLGVRILFDRKKYDDETQGEENGEAKEKRRRLIYQRDSEACQKLFEMLQTMPGSNLGKFFVRRVVQKRAYDVNPKANNYRSRHAIFYGKDEQSKALTAIEAQIHTHDMQRKYDAGEASHEFYKKLQKLEEPEMHLCFMPVLKGLSFDAFRKTPRQ